MSTVTTGGQQASKNPYLEATPWGWPIDTKALRDVLNELYDRYQTPLWIAENGMGNIDVVEKTVQLKWKNAMASFMLIVMTKEMDL